MVHQNKKLLPQILEAVNQIKRAKITPLQQEQQMEKVYRLPVSA